MKYLRRDSITHIIVETEDQIIKLFLCIDFHPYHSYRDPAQVIMYTIQIAMATQSAD